MVEYLGVVNSCVSSPARSRHQEILSAINEINLLYCFKGDYLSFCYNFTFFYGNFCESQHVFNGVYIWRVGIEWNIEDSNSDIRLFGYSNISVSFKVFVIRIFLNQYSRIYEYFLVKVMLINFIKSLIEYIKES